MLPTHRHTLTLTGAQLGSSSMGTPYFFIKNLNGSEAINQLFAYDITALTQDEYGKGILDTYISKSSARAGGAPGSNLDLQPLIGSSVTVAIELDGAIAGAAQVGVGVRHINGIVTRAHYAGVSERHANYRLHIQPWLYLLTLRVNYQIHQKRSIPDILKSVFDQYPYPVETRLTASYPQLDYVVQYGESDFAFVSRLMQEVGISYYFAHAADKHTLILTDTLSGFKPLSPAYQSLRVYPPDLKLPEEYVSQFAFTQTLTTGQVRMQDFQFKAPKADQSVSAHHPWDTAHNQLERYEWHQGRYVEAEAGTPLVNVRMQALRQHGQRAQAAGNLRGIEAGHTFTLGNHPTDDLNRGWLVIGTTLSATENIDPREPYHIETQFTVQPDTEQVRPERITPKPHAPTQTATVTGPTDKEIWTDQYGRVKVQFHWQNQRSGSSHRAVGDENSTCWVRVSTPWAGTHFGGVQIPRVGQEVIVGFLNSDPDMPIITGRVSNPDTMPPWELPTQQALSGFKSKELYGSQTNHLIMDDTTEQVQVQLSTEHQLSQLNLGHITRIPDTTGRKDYRGQGFELRTDGHGALRAGKGILLSTDARTTADKHLTDLSEAASLLKAAQQQQHSSAQQAIDHKADERGIDDTAQTSLKTQNEEITGQSKPTSSPSKDSFPELSAPHIVMSAPAGIALATPKTTHITSNEHLALTTGKDLSMSVGKKLIASVAKGISLFSQSLGIKAYAAKGKIEIQAQSDNVELTAQKVFKIISAKKSITFAAAEEIILTAKGSYIKINGAGIEEGTPANWVAHSASKDLPGPKSLAYEMPKDPYDEMFVIVNQNKQPVANFKYKITTADGTIYRGVSNEKGETIRLGSQQRVVGLKIDPDDGGA